MMYRNYLSFMFLYPIFLFAQDNTRQISIEGRVQDYVSHVDLHGASVELLREDSTLVSSTVADRGNIGSRNLAGFMLVFKAEEGKYILRISFENYESQHINIQISNLKDKHDLIKLPIVYLHPVRELELREVEIVTTKVKFYYKGDTLVYNANAFHLADGSMLDNLVSQLPGAQLSPDGKIYVNGRFVDELLLNGREFFRGDNSILLKNLPTYMVDKVKVYDKLGDLSTIAGKDMGDKTFVMDVYLKKKYNVGLVGNMDVGVGTDKRYLARLFAMRMTDHSRISLYFNQNNVNDHAAPGQNNSFSPDKMPLGKLTSRLSGLDINIWGRDDKFNLKSTTKYSSFHNNIERQTNKTNFISNASTYDRIIQRETVKNYTISTQNDINLKIGEKGMIDVRQNLTFRHSTPTSSIISTTSQSPFVGYDYSLVDVIYNTSFLTPGLFGNVMNHSRDNSLQRTNTWRADLTLSYFYRFKKGNLFQLFSNARYTATENDMFNQYELDIWTEEQAQDFRNRYQKLPDHGYNYLFGSRFYQFLFSRRLEFRYTYSYEQEYTNTIKELYRLEEIDGWNNNNEITLGVLPSESQYLRTLDLNNSFVSDLLTRRHNIQWDVRWKILDTDKGHWEWNTQFSLQQTNRDYCYRQETETHLFRHWSLFTPETNVLFYSKDGKNRGNFEYVLSHELPNMLYLVNFFDDNNPLIITRGNSNLSYSTLHRWSASYEGKRGTKIFRPSAYLSVTEDAISMAMLYNRQTGKREYYPENINGNWQIGLSINNTLPIGKKRRLYFTNVFREDYINSADLTGNLERSDLKKNIVGTSRLSDDLRLDFKYKEHSLSLRGQFIWTSAHGKSDPSVRYNVYDYNYGFIIASHLPFKLQVSTDLTVYNRCGYNVQDLNNTDFVWNMRLSRPILKGRVVMVADAFDILGQLKNTHYVINAQAKTESQSNTVHRYVMFHTIVQLEKKASKK